MTWHKGEPGFPRYVSDDVLYSRGYTDPMPPRKDCIAIVGSRACTQYGAHMAGVIATACVRAGFTVVSGGAYGIDIAAHRAALAADGDTIVVLAGGVDNVYPAAHREVFAEVAGTGQGPIPRGWLVSTSPEGTVPNRTRFLHRNGTIAELSAAMVVVEASTRSGSMNAATQAHAMGTKVFAVPGPVTSIQSEGTHQLIRQGFATLLADPADLIAEMDGHR